MPTFDKLERLSDALLQPMPPGFGWDFSIVKKVKDCGTFGCALGLALHLGIIHDEGNGLTSACLTHDQLGMNRDDYNKIFLSLTTYSAVLTPGMSWEQCTQAVTPAMVAGAIKKYLKEQANADH